RATFKGRLAGTRQATMALGGKDPSGVQHFRLDETNLGVPPFVAGFTGRSIFPGDAALVQMRVPTPGMGLADVIGTATVAAVLNDAALDLVFDLSEESRAAGAKIAAAAVAKGGSLAVASYEVYPSTPDMVLAVVAGAIPHH